MQRLVRKYTHLQPPQQHQTQQSEEEEVKEERGLTEGAKPRKTATSEAKTVYHSVKHPNMIKPVNLSNSQTLVDEEPESGVYAWFVNFDDKWLRPCLIYKY